MDPNKQQEKIEEEDFFDLKKWRTIRDKPKNMNNRNEAQTMEEMKCVFQLFQNLLNTENIAKLKNDQKDFFINDFFLPFTKELILYRYQLEPSYEISHQIIFNVIEFITILLEKDVLKQSEILKFVFDGSRFYYKNHQQDTDESRILGHEIKPDEQKQQWLESLKQGDEIDAVKKEKHYNKACWSRGIILHKIQDSNDIKVGFLGEYEKYDTYFSLKSHEINPANTMSLDFNWRTNLQVGDVLDVCDTAHVWYNSTVLDRKTRQGDRGHEIIEIKIGYRLYTEEGDKTEESTGRKYSGWSERYDDWFTVTSPRIAQFNKMAKSLFKPASQPGAEEMIDDSRDIIFERFYEKEKFYAVLRYQENKSVVLINLINHFGKIGGFEKIYNRIADTQNRIPFPNLVNLVVGIGQVYQYFYRNFALDFIPKLWVAVKQYILGAPDNILRTFEKEKMEQIFKQLDYLLRRVYSSDQKREQIETFFLDVALKCFRCDFLQEQVIGIKMIQDTIKNIKIDTFKFLNNEKLKKWISEKNIFNSIFQGNSHAQFIGMSTELLKFMLVEDMITEQHIENLWKLKMEDLGTIEKTQAYFKIFKDISEQYKQIHIEKILHLIQQLPKVIIQKEHIELIQEIFGKNASNNKNHIYILTALNCLWNILMIENKNIKKIVSEKALEQFLNLTKSLENKEERYGFIVRCIKNIVENNVTQSSIQILKQIIEIYPVVESEENKETQNQIITKLCQENNIVTIILENIQQLKNESQNHLKNQIGNGNDKDYEEFCKKYIEKLEIRVNFIRFMNSILKKDHSIVNFKLLSDLWDQMIVNSLIVEEKDLMFKWLKEFDKEKDKNIEEVVKFFKEKVVQNTDFLTSLTQNGFDCFKQLFIAINLQQNKISQKQQNQNQNNNNNNSVISDAQKQEQIANTNVTSNPTKQQIYQKKNEQGKVTALSNAPLPQSTSGNNNIDTSSSNNNNNNNNQEKYYDFDYQAETHPNQLQGVQMLWMMVEYIQDKNVVEKCAEFITKIFLNLSPRLDTNIKEIRQYYIDYCIQNLKSYQQKLQQSSQLNQLERDQTENKIGRLVMMVRVFLCESEKNGIGGIKSHSGLVKGEIQTLSITNDLNGGSIHSDVPKKIDLKIYSNKTILDLRVEIAKKIKVTWDEIKLKKMGYYPKDIVDSDNGRTIGEMRFKNLENITVTRRPTPPIPYAKLLDADNQLLDKPKQIFTDLFKIFSKNGYMDEENCANFITAATNNDVCKKEDGRVSDVIKQWDDDKDGLLTEKNFLDFYIEACLNKTTIVWKNLSSLHYRNDLKRFEDIDVDDINIDHLPRFFLMNNEDFYQMLFDLVSKIENKDVNTQLKGLLQQLPTSQLILKQVINLEGIKNVQNPNWSQIFDEGSHFKLLYVLTVIEYLMEDEEEEIEQQIEPEKSKTNEQGSKELTPLQVYEIERALLQQQHDQKDQKQKTVNEQQLVFQAVKNSEWRSDFVFLGGFEQLFKVFQKLVQKETLSITQKNIVSFILKIIKNYFTAALGKTIPHIYQIVNYTKNTSFNIDVINENLNESEQELLQSQKIEIEQQNSQQSQSQSQQSQSQSSEVVQQSQQAVSNPVLTDEEKQAQSQEQKTQDEKNQKRRKLKIKESKEFLLLVEKLSEGLGNKILQTLDLQSLLLVIVNLINAILSSKGEVEAEDRQIIDYGMSIIIGILVYSDECLDVFINIPQIDQILISGLYFKQIFNIRKVFVNSLYLLQRQRREKVVNWILEFLLKNMVYQEDETKAVCKEYFEILCKVLEEAVDVKVLKLDYYKLLEQEIQNVINHVSTDKRNNLIKNDTIMIGHLNIIERIMKVKQEYCKQLGSFAQYIFNTCLFHINPKELLENELDLDNIDENFDFNPKNYIKCKSFDSRKLCFKILIHIIKNNSNCLMEIFENGFIPLVNQIPVPTRWYYRPKDNQKTMYAGINNLSQICYMNSMLQQLFMTKTFRYLMLQLDDKEKENLQKYEGREESYQGKQVDDNLLHQFQRMLAFLEFTDRQAYNPATFCFSFKDHDGKPINVGQQQDTQEFLQRFFLLIEKQVKSIPERKILENIYEGKTCFQRICQVCGNVRERIENFCNLSLTVQNMRSMGDALDNNIKGEAIEGFFCEVCQKQQNIIQRLCLAHLPNVLIVHLQRIVFDMETFQMKKVNSKYEFQTQINLEPYTQEGLAVRDSLKNNQQIQQQQNGNMEMEEPPKLQQQNSMNLEKSNQSLDEQNLYKLHPKEYYQYTLKGIVVHQGTAQGGHYFSYIKYQNNLKQEKWAEFNDSNIKDFDPKDIEKECFGGRSSNNSDDALSKIENSRSAYILVYEREYKENLKFVYENEEERIQTIKKLKIDSENIKEIDEENKTMDIQYDSIKRVVNKDLFSQVWLDNHNFMLEKQIYCEDFFTFVMDVLQNVQVPEDFTRRDLKENKGEWNLKPQYYKNHNNLNNQMKTVYKNILEFLNKLVYSILARANDNQAIKIIINQILNFIDLVPEYAYEYLKRNFFDQTKEIMDLIITCPEASVRRTVGVVVVYITNTVIEFNKLKMNDEEQDKSDNHEMELELCKFFKHGLNLLNTDVAKSWAKMQQFLEMYRDFVFSGDVQVDFAFRNEFIARFIDFFLEKESPLQCYGEKKHGLGGKIIQPCFGPLIQLISDLTLRAESLIDLPPVNYQGKVYRLSVNEKICLNSKLLYDNVMKSGEKNIQVFSKVCIHLCYQNDSFSKQVAKILLQGLNKSYDDIKPYLPMFEDFLTIQDNFQIYRLEWILGVPQIKYNKANNFSIIDKIDESSVFYESTLDLTINNISVLYMLYEYRNRWENLVVILLNKFLKILMNQNAKHVFDYILYLPPPSINCAKYLDWIGLHLSNTQHKIKNNLAGTNLQNNKDLVEESIILYDQVYHHATEQIKFIKKQIQEMLKFQNNMIDIEQEQEQQKHPEDYIETLTQNFIIGKIVSEKVIGSEVITMVNSKLVSLKEVEIVVKLVPSRPTVISNNALPANTPMSAEGQFLTENIDKESNFFQIVYNGDKSRQHSGPNSQVNHQIPQNNNQAPPPLNQLIRLQNAGNPDQNTQIPLIEGTIPYNNANFPTEMIEEEELSKKGKKRIRSDEDKIEEDPMQQNMEIRITTSEEFHEEKNKQNQAKKNGAEESKETTAMEEEKVSQNVNANSAVEETKQIDQQMQQIIDNDAEMQKKMQERVRVDFDNVIEHPYIRKFYVSNESDDIIHFQFKLAPMEGSQMFYNLNFNLAKTDKVITIKPKTDHLILLINKNNISFDFGDYAKIYTYKPETVVVSNDDNKNKDNKQPSNTIPDTPAGQEPFKGPLLPGQTAVQPTDTNDNANLEGQMKTCKACTYDNLSIFNNCEMCNSPLD